MHLYREDINQCGLAGLEHKLDSDVENVYPGRWESEFMVGGAGKSVSFCCLKLTAVLLPQHHKYWNDRCELPCSALFLAFWLSLAFSIYTAQGPLGAALLGLHCLHSGVPPQDGRGLSHCWSLGRFQTNCWGLPLSEALLIPKAIVSCLHQFKMSVSRDRLVGGGQIHLSRLQC